MKLIICLTVALAAVALVATGEQQRILRRVIKSTPTATNLARVRLVTVRATNGAESGAVTEITSKEAASFGQRSANETTSGSASPAANQPAASGSLKTKLSPQSTTSSTTTTPSTATSTTTSTTTAAPTSSSSATPTKPKASERQQVSGSSTSGTEVELLAGAPSSWQTMTAVEAPAAMLIATGTRPAVSADLTSAGSTLYASEESVATNDFLRGPAGTKGGAYNQQQVGETFSRLRQQSASKQSVQHQQQQQQQSFFYPQPAPVRASPSKTSHQQASKTHWYQQPSITTPRPAPIVQEQQYEQQNEYVQQQQVEYGAAPLGQAEPFAFDFKTEDNSGNGQYRKEESDKNGVVHGSYGYTDANGIYRHVEYVADKDGFRANIKSNEPGLIGETQPASIQLSGSGPTPNQRLAARPQSSPDNGEWTANNNDNNDSPSPSADLALAPPDFESAHKSDRLRLPRHYRN